MGVVLGVIVSVVGIFVGCCVLAIVEGRLEGREQPNLEMGMAAVYGVLGGVLFPFWGWTSTLGLFGVLVVWTLVWGLMARLRGW